MAKQLGIFPLGGTIGNVTFFKTADGGFGARNKSSLTGAEMAANPKFERMLKHSKEFARAGKAMSKLRGAIQPLLAKTGDSKAARRLHQKLRECTRADVSHPLGLRTPQDGDLSLLMHFNFNIAALLRTTMAAPYTATIDRVTGAMDLSVPAFNPMVSLSIPANATHFKIVIGAAGVDFLVEEQEFDSGESAYLPLTNALTTPLTLSATLSANSTRHLIMVMGVRFYEEINSAKEPIYSHAPLAIVGVES
jgi:hypothetical protein